MSPPDVSGRLVTRHARLVRSGGGREPDRNFWGGSSEAWKALKASYDGLSDAEMRTPGVTGTWSVRDIIAHVTTWEEESLVQLPVVLTGKQTLKYSVAYGGIDAFNAQVTERRRKLSLCEVLRQRDEVHRRLVGFIGNVPAEQIVQGDQISSPATS